MIARKANTRSNSSENARGKLAHNLAWRDFRIRSFPAKHNTTTNCIQGRLKTCPTFRAHKKHPRHPCLRVLFVDLSLIAFFKKRLSRSGARSGTDVVMGSSFSTPGCRPGFSFLVDSDGTNCPHCGSSRCPNSSVDSKRMDSDKIYPSSRQCFSVPKPNRRLCFEHLPILFGSG